MDPESKQQPQAPHSPWHTLATEVALEHVRSASTGLTTTEAVRRLGEFGPNELQARKSVSAWETFVAQFKNVLILILLSATIMSGFLGHTLEAVVITVIVLFAVLLGFIQEYRASRALEALAADGGAYRARAARRRGSGRRRARPGARRRRGAAHGRSRARRHPADSGRSTSPSTKPRSPANRRPAQKTIGRVRRCAAAARRSPQHDLRGHAGRATAAARAVVVSTGMSTEFGQIARMVETRRGQPHAAAGEPRSSGRHARQGGAGRGRACRRHRSAARPAARSRCSCSASRWRWPSSPRRCRRSSRSRWRSACGAWSSGTRSSGVCPSSRRSAAPRSSAPTRPAR